MNYNRRTLRRKKKDSYLQTSQGRRFGFMINHKIWRIFWVIICITPDIQAREIISTRIRFCFLFTKIQENFFFDHFNPSKGRKSLRCKEWRRCWGERTITMTGFKQTEDDDWRSIYISEDPSWQGSMNPNRKYHKREVRNKKQRRTFSYV